jgi:hypothetical protein
MSQSNPSNLADAFAFAVALGSVLPVGAPEFIRGEERFSAPENAVPLNNSL